MLQKPDYLNICLNITFKKNIYYKMINLITSFFRPENTERLNEL